ncbi:putative AAA domain-containing protein C24B10.10c [Dichanthelium oligosanthes]|uniref:Putative AAA domain-containing protein C24B10.10c n=1 Tax=Dichanthelium oligosanthes TaxID=888268 RepID=A0A1E5WN02_9POAL|nr:putative AAA domain-containing protein C24B10.10c [Dichanthelium oligosanthes]
MEQRNLLVSALGVGVGVGLGLASARWAAPAHGEGGGGGVGAGAGPAEVEAELRRLVLDGRESEVTFDEFHNFHYYLSDQTKEVLISAAFVHLKKAELSKHIRNLSAASRAILLSGPTEPYLQSLAKALSHYFKSRLLILDATDFSLRIQSKYGGSSKVMVRNQPVAETTLGKMSGFIGSFMTYPKKDEPRVTHPSFVFFRGSDGSTGTPSLRKNASVSSDMSDLSSQCSGHSGVRVKLENPMTQKYLTILHFSSTQISVRRTSSWCFDEKVLIQSLYKVMISESENDPIILYIRDVDLFLWKSQRTYSMFQKMLAKLSGQVLILGSRLLNADADNRDVDERVSTLFPYHVDIKPPEEETHLDCWKNQMEEDTKKFQMQDNRNHIIENFLYSLSHGLSIFQGGHGGKDTLKLEETKDGLKGALGSKKTEKDKSTTVPVGDGPLPPPKPEIPDNEFEKRIRPEVIPASEIGVTFDDIGALADIKESLQELVMLPLRRPDLFKGGLLKPCRGILLFGPPGTGKTMLAKAIANDAGASFINVSMSTITSKWFGEDEKNVRALFSLAAKVAPTIIFVDEVDSMLGQRARSGEHEAMRKIKNEFMSHWDGLLSKSGERVLVLAATNRPFDLDEAIIRRFERRIMVGLPTQESRELILRTLLSKEKVDKNIDFKELATMTEGYSGSDLKNLCVTAAYRPVRELLKKEREKELERREEAKEKAAVTAENPEAPVSKEENSESKEENSESKEENSDGKADSSEAKAEGEKEAINDLRPLTMEDLKQAKNQVAASFAAEGAVMNELKQWNDLYGEGGSRKKQQLTYFL